MYKDSDSGSGKRPKVRVLSSELTQSFINQMKSEPRSFYFDYQTDETDNPSAIISFNVSCEAAYAEPPSYRISIISFGCKKSFTRRCHLLTSDWLFDTVEYILKYYPSMR